MSSAEYPSIHPPLEASQTQPRTCRQPMKVELFPVRCYYHTTRKHCLVIIEKAPCEVMRMSQMHVYYLDPADLDQGNMH